MGSGCSRPSEVQVITNRIDRRLKYESETNLAVCVLGLPNAGSSTFFRWLEYDFSMFSTIEFAKKIFF